MNTRKLTAAVFGCVLLLGAAGCKKPVAAAPKPIPPPEAPAPPPPPPKPQPVRIDAFAVEPATIQRGQQANLRWTVANATDIQINQNIGVVTANGTRAVTPQNSTTYTLTATGQSGIETRSVTLTVNIPPPPPPPVVKPKVSFNGADFLSKNTKDAFFDYDSSDIRGDARNNMQQNADVLKQIFQQDPTFRVVLEGHCDERGSAEYNLGLGDRRSTSGKDYLVQLGVPADRITTISYGKDRPQCTSADEDCYQRNRRVHLAPAQ